MMLSIIAVIFCGFRFQSTLSQPSASCNVECFASENQNFTLNLYFDYQQMWLFYDGPVDLWYGVGFGANHMNGTYAIIIDGVNGTVTERKLGDHTPGILLPSTTTIKENTVSGDTRHMQINRALKINDTDYYSFSEQYNLKIPVIFAYGRGPQFGYHQNKSTSFCDED